MFALPDRAPPLVSSPSSTPTCAPQWARVLGVGSIHRDFGHHIATNARGELLVAARLEQLEDDTQDDSQAVTTPTLRDEATVDLSGGALLKLTPNGDLAWSVRLRAAHFLLAPNIALDDTGGAYVAGPYMPVDGALRGARQVSVTKLGPKGGIEWSRPLVEVPLERGRPCAPVVRVAADPTGGACVTWIGELRRWRAVRAVRITNEAAVAWECAWPVTAGDAFEPHVGFDATGAALVWGTFHGTLAVEDGVVAESGAEARYLARVQADGRIRWAYSVRAYPNTPYAIAVGRGGEIGHAYVILPNPHKPAAALPILVLLRIDPAGTPLSSARGHLERHSAISSLDLASTPGGGFALAGYFSGTLRLGGAELRSATPASEAVFVAHAGLGSDFVGRAFHGPQLQAGLSIHGGAHGAVVLAGWLCGTMTLGAHRVVNPTDRAALFVASVRAS